jgi:hypothetical protein
MLQRLRENWQRIKRGEPGRRFRDCYESERHHGASRTVLCAAGIALILIGLFLVPAPVLPGWVVVMLGLALLSAAWRPLARLLDWTEPRLRFVLASGKSCWQRASKAVRIVVAGITLLGAAGLAWVMYALVLPE